MTETGTHRPQGGGLDEETRQMVVDTVHQLSQRLLTKQAVLEWDRDEIFPEEAVREMLSPDVGLQLLFIPEAYGGMGGGAMDCCVVTREMSKICLGVEQPFLLFSWARIPLLSAELKRKRKNGWAPLPKAKVWSSYAVTEPEAGRTWHHSKPRPSRSPMMPAPSPVIKSMAPNSLSPPAAMLIL